MAILTKPDGSFEQVRPADPSAGFSLEELYRYLHCTTVEMVSLGSGVTMWLDEHGKAREIHEVNAVATALPARAGGMPGDYVVGRALLCNPDEVK